MSAPGKPDSVEPSDEAELVWSLIEEGRGEDALARLAGWAEDEPGRWTAEALARLELDDLDGARSALGRAARDDGADEVGRAWARATLALREWRLEDAETDFGYCAEEAADEPCTFERLSLCADLRGDAARADALLEIACELDPVSYPQPPRLTPAAFEALVTDAISDLPPAFREALEIAEIVVEPVPYVELIDARDTAGTPPDLLGLFVGAFPSDTEQDASGELPPRIHLFQRNIERACCDRTELMSEIRVTLYHELAHMLGFDEDGVPGMGLE